jgi:hypothetical protein
MAAESQRDLVLPPQSFAWVLDKGKGYINTLVGPTKTPMSEQERPVRFNSATRKYEEISTSRLRGITWFWKTLLKRASGPSSRRLGTATARRN